MSNDFNQDYDVGFGKPPKDSQFKPGQSGNKKGRPKGSKNFLNCLDENLEQKVNIKENGKIVKKTKMEIIASQLVNKAASGDLKAIANIVPYISILEAKEEEKEKLLENLSKDDKKIVAIVFNNKEKNNDSNK